MFFDLGTKSFEMNYKIAPTYYTRLLGVLENVLPGEVLLNAGCGTGEFNFYLRDRFEQSYGVDINADDIASAKVLTEDPNIQFDTGDITKLDFPDEFFDAVICVDVLEHVDEPEQAVRELRRVLKPGGQLVVTVPNHRYPFFYDPINFILERLFRRHLPIGIWGFGHTKLFTQESLVELLEDAGFSVLKSELLTHSLCGLIEGYLPTILQPFFKSNAKNMEEALGQERKEAKRGFSYDIPALPAQILNGLVALDRKLGGRSSYGVGILVKVAVS